MDYLKAAGLILAVLLVALSLWLARPAQADTRERIGIEKLEEGDAVARYHDKRSGAEILCFWGAQSVSGYHAMSCVTTGRKW